MKRHWIIVVAGLIAGGACYGAGAEEQPALSKTPVTKTPEQLEAERARRIEAQNKVWNAMSVEERARLLQLHSDLQQLPKEELKIIRERINRYLRMKPEERKQLEENYERWAKMSPAEREKARQSYLRLRWEHEQRWRKEHPGQEPPPFRLSKPAPAPAATTEPAINSPVSTAPAENP